MAALGSSSLLDSFIYLGKSIAGYKTENTEKSAQENTERPGTGALQGSTVSVGYSSNTENQSVETQSVETQAPKSELVGLPVAGSYSKTFSAGVCDLTPLKKPMEHSLTHNEKVMEALVDHAGASEANAPISEKEIREFVILGEHIAKAIQAPRPSSINFKGYAVASHVTPNIPINSNMQTTRALSWYMMACAAKQDVERAEDRKKEDQALSKINGQVVTDLSKKGAYLMPDPGQKIAKFLNGSTLAYHRVSTHFRERSLSKDTQAGLPVQRGIEDPLYKLPGEKGALLFDSLSDPSGQPVLFIKFESTGWPQVNHGDENGDGKVGIFDSIWRKVKHSLSFLESRFAHHSGMERKEHIYKGILADSVYKPYIDVMKKAKEAGFGSELTESQHKSSAQDIGFPFVEEQLGELEAKLKDANQLHSDLGGRVTALLKSISENKDVLDERSKGFGITRRGAETHISLNQGVNR